MPSRCPEASPRGAAVKVPGWRAHSFAAGRNQHAGGPSFLTRRSCVRRTLAGMMFRFELDQDRGSVGSFTQGMAPCGNAGLGVVWHGRRGAHRAGVVVSRAEG
jgi:hypothetical protein